MTTEVKIYRATTMQEALDLVRKELGSEAVILHTRQISRRRLLPWKKSKQEVEITAGVGVNVRSHVAVKRRHTSAKKKQVHAATPNEIPNLTGLSHSASNGSAQSHKNRIENRPANLQRENVKKPTSGFGGLSSAVENPNAQNIGQTIQNNASQVDLATKLNSIENLLEKIEKTRKQDQEIPNELFHLYTDMIDAEVEDDLSRDLIFQLKEKFDADELKDAQIAREKLTEMVEAEIRCADPISTVPGQRQVVALVGATGVGKTTTIAKLAANLRLREGVKMGLVTVDTYRIAAVEQLRTYAEIIDLPMKVVTSPPEMRRALDELSGLDLVLIDTAGRSPRDELQIQELKSLLAVANVDEVHLVLNMTASLKTLQVTVEKFSAVNTTSLIMTKLDEAVGMGTLLSVSQKIDLPISYLTTGQDVPDDIETAKAGRIARLVLGQDTLG